MNGTYKIFRFLGFDISIHWSWIFIFVLVTWTFAAGILEEFYPDWTDGRRWVVGAAISIIFFISILLHEVSHSVVARRYGIAVSNITLFVFGGVSNLTKEPDSAKQEFWIAIVGPLTSFVMAAVFGIGYLLLNSLEEGAGAVAANLAVINLAIGLFNLVPGFPLDGGRVLRSIFWARNRSLLDATRLASAAGQGVAYAIMALGALSFIFVSVITGIWLFLIGNFLRSASASSYQQLFVDTVLKGIPAMSVAKQGFVPIPPTMTLAELVEQHVLSGDGRAFPVMAGEELHGLITLTDLRAVPREEWATTTVYRAMTPVSKLRTVTPRDDLIAVLNHMAAADINQVPVLDGRLLVGMIDRGDLLRFIQVRQEISSGAS